ncbi:omega-amidase NIT2-like [Clytia hemisphaerica]|uniref:omega-amidase n=1 Tax=Clytia hemisphaerica TaxID=252671 RepID=A0A7M5V1H5_9CNID
MASALKLALIQSRVFQTKSQTLSRVKELIETAVKQKSNLVCLPEIFNGSYGLGFFIPNSEEIPGETSNFLSGLAKEHSIHLVGGSISEKDGDKYYNTCLVYGPDGSLVAKHRKVHLFDIDVPGGIKFTESEILSPGNSTNSFNIGPWKIGLGICYDIRFPELSAVYAKQGCNLLLFPSAFNMTTGPKHWELLTRARANDFQLYTAMCSPARDENASYVAWGHSTVCNPWAEVIAKAGIDEEIIYADLDLQLVETVRQSIPTRQQKRHDVYEQSKM